MICLCIGFVALAVWLIKSIGEDYGTGHCSERYKAYYRSMEYLTGKRK